MCLEDLRFELKPFVKEILESTDHRVPVTIGKSYKVKVLCIMDDIDECHILLGIPWLCEVNGKYDVKQNLYLFSWEGRKIVMVSPKVTPQLTKA
ncbi:hypothetical protein Tco_1458603 [Tanacetum coccineum]